MLLWTFGLKEDFVKGEEALPLPIFAPSWIYPLEYLAETSTRMAAFQVKPFVFEALFESFLPYLGSTPGHKNCIPTKFHKHPWSGSVVKADYVCSHIYTCISASPLFSPKLIHKNFIKILQAYIFFILEFSEL